ncbi:hypothetical protein MKQ70_32065 [Chitinophaga sedimenti]|uniref:hypothetical protein n=1 Tax=Chitinophaga sedimenti TaxID=2033606 RepID=UPI0020057ACE|nr:hypothetical protein [Chitinophaga sedimenti]MCK7559354.1 hypothetical protein [Chitinophaga sedimenti]
MVALNQINDTPFVDNTGITTDVTMELPKNLKDYNALLAVLKKYGIKMELKVQGVEFMVFTDKTN